MLHATIIMCCPQAPTHCVHEGQILQKTMKPRFCYLGRFLHHQIHMNMHNLLLYSYIQFSSIGSSKTKLLIGQLIVKHSMVCIKTQTLSNVYTFSDCNLAIYRDLMLLFVHITNKNQQHESEYNCLALKLARSSIHIERVVISWYQKPSSTLGNYLT